MTSIVLLRFAGFANEILLRLGGAPAPWELLAAEDRAVEERKKIVEILRATSLDGLSAEERKIFVRLQRALREGKTPPGDEYNGLRALEDDVARLRIESKNNETSALAAARKQLREISADPRFLEAVFLQSPTALIGIEKLAASGPENTSSIDRQREHLAIMHLQRLCAKNDTNSFFGPTAIVSWNATADSRFRADDQKLNRKVYLSYWPIQEIAQIFAREQGALKRLRVNPTLRETGDGHVWVSTDHAATGTIARRYRAAHLDARTQEILRAIDDPERNGPRDGRWIDDRDTPILEQLAKAGIILSSSYELPYGLFDPDEQLDRELSALPESETKTRAVRGLSEKRRAFATAPLEERRTLLASLEHELRSLSGKEPRRGAGEHYSDRSVIHEECGTEVEGTPLTAELARQVEAVLPALASLCFLGVAADRARLRSWFGARYGEQTRVPLIEVERAIDRGDPALELCPEADAVGAAAKNITASLAAAIDRARVNQTAAIISSAELASASSQLSWTGLDAGYFSVDLMIAEESSGVRTPIIGECHGLVGPQTFLCDAIPNSPAIIAALRENIRLLVPRGSPAEIVLRHTSKTDARHALAPFDLEIAAASPRPRNEVFTHREVDVFRDREGILRLETPRGELVPLTTGFYYPLLHWLSPVPPIQNDARARFFPDEYLPAECRTSSCPRLVLDGVVLRRASWSLAIEGLKTALAAPGGPLAGITRLRHTHHIPRWIFAGFREEAKPIYFDLETPIFLEALRRLVNHSKPDGRVTFSEMLPGPEHLFLESATGKRTFELRFGVHVRPSGTNHVEAFVR